MGTSSRSKKLTERQRAICEMLIGGLINKQIAHELGISHRTVEWHRTEILRKMEVNNVLCLCRRVYEARIAEMQAQINQLTVENPPLIYRRNGEPALNGAA